MRTFHLTSIVAAAFALAAAAPARADDVTFTGFAHGSQSVDYSLFAPNAAASGSASAGGFATVLNGGPSFVSYCVDLYQHISFGTLYPEYTPPGTGHVFINPRAYDDLGRQTESGIHSPLVHHAVANIDLAFGAMDYTLDASHRLRNDRKRTRALQRFPCYAQTNVSIRWFVLTNSKKIDARVANRTDSSAAPVAKSYRVGAKSKLIQQLVEHRA